MGQLVDLQYPFVQLTDLKKCDLLHFDLLLSHQMSVAPSRHYNANLIVLNLWPCYIIIMIKDSFIKGVCDHDIKVCEC